MRVSLNFHGALATSILLGEEVSLDLVRRVVTEGYAPDLTDVQIEELGRDPFLVAYAMAGAERCVVTTEVSKPTKNSPEPTTAGRMSNLRSGVVRSVQIEQGPRIQHGRIQSLSRQSETVVLTERRLRDC
jgi:hypothetical protein